MCILDGNDLTLVNFLALKKIIHKIIKLSFKNVYLSTNHIQLSIISQKVGDINVTRKDYV